MRGARFDFTIQGLEKRLIDLAAQGYEFGSDFSQTESSGVVYLRHDVDLSLRLARDVALVESQLNISATFFLQIGSEFYNLHSQEGRSIIGELVKLGHQVGLHFDSRVAVNSNSMSALLAQELEVLEQLTGGKIRYFSQHKPTELGWHTLSHPYAKDVREQTTTGNIEYFSDSTGYFRWGDYGSLTAHRGSFQLLLHPIWWSSATPRHPRASLEKFMEATQKGLYRQVSGTVSKFGHPNGHPLGWPTEITREVID